MTNSRVVDERLRETDALQHAFGELPERPCAFAAQPDPPANPSAPARARRRSPEQSGEMHDELFGRQVIVERRVFRQEAQPPAGVEGAGRGPALPRGRRSAAGSAGLEAWCSSPPRSDPAARGPRRRGDRATGRRARGGAAAPESDRKIFRQALSRIADGTPHRTRQHAPSFSGSRGLLELVGDRPLEMLRHDPLARIGLRRRR